MPRNSTFEYWLDDGWRIGGLREAPGVFSQGQTHAELEDDIRDAYALVKADAAFEAPAAVGTKTVCVS
jgi:predicted RNase H-like HicB family nuclease